MTTWRTRVVVSGSSSPTVTGVILIKRGIFQGDGLSALWFCLGLNPLSNRVSRENLGFSLRLGGEEIHKVSHLLYMDDIKIYASKKDHLRQLLGIVEGVSEDICMEFGVQKCKTLHVERGIIIEEEGIVTNSGNVIGTLSADELYKYLGMLQNLGIKKDKVKERLTALFVSRLKAVLNTSLNSKNMTKAINTYVIAALSYSFGIVPWSDTELEGLNRTIRTSLTKLGKHHPKAAIERVNIPRREGGRGILDLREAFHGQICMLRNHFLSREDSTLHVAICRVDKSYTPLRIAAHNPEEQQAFDLLPRKLENWVGKPLHGRHVNLVQQEHVNQAKSYLWLTKGQLYPETEGFAIAIQDQVIGTRNYRKYITKENTGSDKCRRCNAAPETIDHITSACAQLAAKEYTERHDTMGKIVYQALASNCDLLENPEPYYRYNPPPVLENQRYRLYWNNPVLTDRMVMANRPDVILIDKQARVVQLLDFSIPNGHNLLSKYEEKISKYMPLSVEIKRIWAMDIVYIRPIIMSVTGVVPESLIKHLKELKLPDHLLHTMQKSVILSTCNIVRSFLNME